MPTAASAAFGATVGPRLLPGTYTVRMTRGTAVYTTPLKIVPDPRAKYSPQERKAQFDLALHLSDLLGEMTFTVDRMNGIRHALEKRAAALPASDPLVGRLNAASAHVDDLRKKIVATKEGGMITGEERLRENLCDLYGNVVSYEGRPSQTQVERAAAIAHELGDVEKSLESWAAADLPRINSDLEASGAKQVELLTRQEWSKEGASK